MTTNNIATMTRTELVNTLKEFRDNHGIVLTCKLTAKTAILRAELECIAYHQSKEVTELTEQNNDSSDDNDDTNGTLEFDAKDIETGDSAHIELSEPPKLDVCVKLEDITDIEQSEEMYAKLSHLSFITLLLWMIAVPIVLSTLVLNLMIVGVKKAYTSLRQIAVTDITTSDDTYHGSLAIA